MSQGLGHAFDNAQRAYDNRMPEPECFIRRCPHCKQDYNWDLQEFNHAHNPWCDDCFLAAAEQLQADEEKMRNKSKHRIGLPGPAAIVTVLCQGPRTVNELAAALDCRPSCLSHALHTLRTLRLITTLSKATAGGGPAAKTRIDLAMDPIVAFVLLRADLETPEKKPKKHLHGSLEYLQDEAVRESGTPPLSNCVPLGVPAGRPSNEEAKQ